VWLASRRTWNKHGRLATPSGEHDASAAPTKEVGIQADRDRLRGTLCMSCRPAANARDGVALVAVFTPYVLSENFTLSLGGGGTD
jgi:hypothetical protein